MIRTVLTIVAGKNWPAHQLDFSNAFLHGNLSECVYCNHPTGFEDPRQANTVCLLSCSLYDLRQAPPAWFLRFVEHVTSLSFRQSHSDSSLFFYRRGDPLRTFSSMWTT